MTAPATDNSAQQIIRMALQNVGKLGAGQDPDSETVADLMVRLNGLVRFFQTQGLKLWTQTDLAVPLTAGQYIYNLGPSGDVNIAKPLRSLQGYYLYNNGTRRPLLVLSKDEYTRLSQVTQLGAINSYFIQKNQTQLQVWFWMNPSAEEATNGTPYLVIQQPISGFVLVTDTMNFPDEWFMALTWGLADEISTGQPQALVDRAEKKALQYREALENWDVEDASTLFQPDQRTVYETGRFR